MLKHVKGLLLLFVFLFTGSLLEAEGVKVVYPTWFKASLYDLPGDLQDAREAGKTGIMLFISMKTCSYCNAIIETAFQQADIVKRLRAAYDVIGLEVFSDVEVVDTRGKTHWSKDFAVQEKAKFTPTLIFYDTEGKLQLRLIGYQSPKKIRAALDYLEGKQYARMTFSDYLRQRQSSAVAVNSKSVAVNLDRRKPADKPMLVVFGSADCQKCLQLRTMLENPVMQPYTPRLDIVHLGDAEMGSKLTLPDGEQQTGEDWAKQLGLIHRPAMVFFNQQGGEMLRVDTDILIDSHGKDVPADDAHVLDNIRARLQFVLDDGYVNLPQFQRWRKQVKSQ